MAGKKLKSVYIIEDTLVARTMLKDHLSKYKGIEIKEYSTGNACIRDIILNKEEPDLVLMDYFLDSSFGPSKDGVETLEKLKEISPATEVVMLTSVDNKRIMDLAKEKGALDYVVKGTNGFSELDTVLKKHFQVK